MASLVPLPMEKWAVWAASPTSTMFWWCQRSQRTVGKVRQTERLVRSGWPARKSAKRSWQKATVSSSPASSSPAARQTSSRHSTMKVVVPVSNG